MKRLPLINGFLTFFACTFCIASTQFSIAEEIKIPIGSQGESQTELPHRGLSSKQLLKRFGEPKHVQGPVGNPAISQWHYNEFVVYLEKDYVIHTVKKLKNSSE